jgi:hypothetical protein
VRAAQEPMIRAPAGSTPRSRGPPQCRPSRLPAGSKSESAALGASQGSSRRTAGSRAQTCHMPQGGARVPLSHARY